MIWSSPICPCLQTGNWQWKTTNLRNYSWKLRALPQAPFCSAVYALTNHIWLNLQYSSLPYFYTFSYPVSEGKSARGRARNYQLQLLRLVVFHRQLPVCWQRHIGELRIIFLCLRSQAPWSWYKSGGRGIPSIECLPLLFKVLKPKRETIFDSLLFHCVGEILDRSKGLLIKNNRRLMVS